MKIKIKPNDYYSLLQLHDLRVFKWIKSYSSLKRLIIDDIKNGNKTFNAVKTGKSNGTRYFVRGSTITKLLKEINENGKIF